MSLFKKRVIAVVKVRIFDTSLSAINVGLEGYEKPRRVHTAKTKNIPARKIASMPTWEIQVPYSVNA